MATKDKAVSPSSTAPVTDENASAILAETQDWVEQQLGFAPYYNPKPGDMFLATPLEIDDKDPDFVRFVFIADAPVQCARGPKSDAEPVEVLKGEQFTMGAYASLGTLYEDYMGMKCRVTVIDKIDISGKRSLWRFSLAVSPADNKIIASHRANKTRAKMLASREKAEAARLKAPATAPAQS